MSELLINRQQLISSQIPSSIEYTYPNLTIKKKSILEETLTIALDGAGLYHLNIEDQVEAKIIIDIQDEKENGTFDIDVSIGKASNIKLLVISNIKAKSSKLNIKTSSSKDAALNFMAGFVSDDVDAKLHLNLMGSGASLKVRTIAVSSDRHVQNLDVQMIHHAPNTQAEMTIIGIAGESGVVTLNGVGQIEMGMNGSSNFQTLRGIITSNTARIDVNPILIIDEYDVSAGHAATVGKLEEEVLFYLRSRGLSLLDAQRLMIHGFLKPVIDEIDDEPLKERIVSLVNSRI